MAPRSLRDVSLGTRRELKFLILALVLVNFLSQRSLCSKSETCIRIMSDKLGFDDLPPPTEEEKKARDEGGRDDQVKEFQTVCHIYSCTFT